MPLQTTPDFPTLDELIEWVEAKPDDFIGDVSHVAD